MSKQVESKVEIGIEYYNTLIKQSRELAELKEKAIEITFSKDERHVHIKGKGIYTLQDCKPALGGTVTINVPKTAVKE